MKLFIYSLIDPITNEVRYVGKTYNPEKRYKQHIYKSKIGKTHRDFWIQKLIKIGQKPIINVIEECNEENWMVREQYYISMYDNLTNLTNGGEGTHGYTPSKETIEKIKLSNTGKKRSDEFKKAAGLRRLGAKHNDKTKKLMSSKRLGKAIHSEGHKNKLKIKVKQLDLDGNLIKIWNSVSEATKEYPNVKISECINNKRKTSLGYKWEKII